MSGIVPCPACQTPLPTTLSAALELAPCVGCGRQVQGFAFPALGRSLPSSSVGQSIVMEGEASCFYHPQKRSVLPCSACGRFLCALCDLDVNGQHLCPACLETGQRKGKLESLENRRALYDNMALAVATLPFLFWPITILTGPAAVVCSILWWKKPSSLLPRTRLRLVLAMLLGLVQTLTWAGMVFALVWSTKRHG